MLKIYGNRAEEVRLLSIMAEFPKLRVISNEKIKGFTRKCRGGHKVMQYPIV